MKSGDFLSIRLWTGIPPWILIGAAVILFPIFSFMTIENINRQKAQTEKLLEETGAALIRSFEAGTRTGMAGYWREFQLQRLLVETAQQPDVVYLIVTDVNGTIIASSSPEQIGNNYGKGIDLSFIAVSAENFRRILTADEGKKVFEIYRRFVPMGPPTMMHKARRIKNMPFSPPMLPPSQASSEPRFIFVGLDMDSIEEARLADAIHTVVMGLILLCIGFAGVTTLFLAQNYRMTRASLSRIKAFSDTLVENMPIGLIALDTTLIITSFNQVADRFLNLSAVNAIGKNASDILPPKFLELVANAEIEKNALEKEIVCRISGDVRLPLEVSASKLKDEKGDFLGYVLLFKDLREVRLLQKALARSQRLASIGSLAAGVAHEIRNPLSSIKGLATYFRDRHHEIPEDQEVSAIMIQEVDRLNRVVSQLLEFAKPVAILKQPIAISEVISNTIKLIDRHPKDQEIEIKTHISSDIPVISADKDKINQVFLNLLLNSVEAMTSGGNIDIKAFADQDHLVVQIADTGTGISETDITQIFNPYFTTKQTGTGLGLAIVHNILEAHDGDIRVENQTGRGTLVTIRLPLENQVQCERKEIFNPCGR